MRGAIAAGHEVTAETGARVLAAGGNAVDACVAAGFASWVAESTLTGPGGGGFMLVHRAHDRGARLLDFFVAVPGRGLPPHERAEMEEVDVDFDRDVSQVFHIGAPSTAVPGTAAGLEAAHRAYGTRPWAELVAPAIELAREGVELNRPQAYLHAILDVILRHTEEGRRIYQRDGERLVAGDRLAMPDLARTLEAIADHGARALYDGELGRALVAHVREHGGEIDERDLAEYRIIWRRPVRATFEGHEFLSNPPPSSGGVLIAYGLRLLDRLALDAPPGSAEELATLAEVMREQTRARGLGFTAGLYRGGLAGRLLAESEVEQGLARVRGRLDGLAEPVGAPGTTQISVVDAQGNAASMTASTGSGSGVVVPGTGMHLNNMLGEYDLVAASARPGMRLTSMMAPSLVLRGELPRPSSSGRRSATSRGAGSSPRTAGGAPATSAATSVRSAATRTPPSTSPRTRAASSAASRSRATSTRRATTSPTSA